MAALLIVNLDSPPLSACSEPALLGRRNAEYDKTRSKFFGMTYFRQDASANPLESHTNKKPCIYIKTIDFKPFRITFLCNTFSQVVWNHILTKNRGGGTPSSARQSGASFCHTPTYIGNV